MRENIFKLGKLSNSGSIDEKYYMAFGMAMWGGFTSGKCICNKLVFL